MRTGPLTARPPSAQGTLGAPKMPKPSSLDPEALKRWTAWYTVSGMTEEQAMLAYSEKVIELYLSEPTHAAAPDNRARTDRPAPRPAS